MREDGKWVPGRWWRALDTDGTLWLETSDKEEAIASMEEGMKLQNLWVYRDTEWRDWTDDTEEKEELEVAFIKTYKEWERGRWWRVLNTDNSLWLETSDKEEAEASMEEGMKLQNLWVYEDADWRDWIESEENTAVKRTSTLLEDTV